jgi:alkanesulfonate monooxygenase SsuD/methylene tetrahydromethanopterin reductase-like flavin-dependent oxidoreductase (luciferase family)
MAVEFGINLLMPSSEEVDDRQAYFMDLLRISEGAFTSAWVPDHLMNHERPMLEAWTTITWFAARAPSFTFGNLVLSQSYRNPALLAKMAATFDYWSGGRLILGIGAGWQADEYAAYDYPYPSAGTRIEQLGEAIDVLRALWTQSPATYDGRYYHVRDAYCEPRPAQPIPILLGGRKPKFMRIAAEKADIWQWDGPIQRWRVPYELLVANCAEIGRPLSSIALSTFGEVYFPERPEDFPEEMPLGFDDAAKDPSGAYAGEYDWIIGPTPEDAIEALRPLVEAGVRQVTLYFWDRRSLERFIRDVVPAFR